MKQQEDRISREELLKAVKALEEILTAEMYKEEEEREVSNEKLPKSISSLEKAKEKIRKELKENDGAIGRNNLYRKVRGDRMGSGTFFRAMKALEDKDEITIFKKETKGRPAEIIRLLRGIES